MRILRSYILKECILPFFLALAVLTCIFLLGNLIQLANLVINKGVKITMMGKVFLLYIPLLLGYTLPLACLISIILAFSRLSADNEILAIRTSGIHTKKILFPLMILGVVISLISIILNEKIIPFAHYEQRRVLKQLGASNPTALLEAGIFIHSFKNQILFIHKIEDNKLYNVTIYQPQPNDRPTRTIIAKRGEFTPIPGENKIKIKLMDGTSDEIDPRTPDNFYKLNFKNYFMTLDISKEEGEGSKKPKSMTLKELTQERERLQSLFIDPRRIDTEYHRKITWSFASFFFILLGFPMAVITHRRERTINVALAMGCAVVYYLLSLGAEAISIQTSIPPMLAMWVPNVIAGIVAIFLNYKLART
ncbi:MAG: LPS export ABC transporter permease LptF [Omnitrophica WOR_2 bacterium GWA2_47_8]|nr:MAG: LPS export ABC transporter permease LptF [Omnitrophica WOR_2 bacterium GWA2_47_8]